MFRREEVSYIIKKCNDFGAGGVSVAIGELAPGLQIDLDKVPKKYAGLDLFEDRNFRVPGAYGSCCCSGRRREIPWFCKRREPGGSSGFAVVTKEPRLVLSLGEEKRL